MPDGKNAGKVKPQDKPSGLSSVLLFFYFVNWTGLDFRAQLSC